MTPLEKAVKRVLQKGRISCDNLPIITLEEFFDGNDEDDSLAVNCACKIGEVGDFLMEARKRDDVADVRIEVSDFTDKEEASWPFSELVIFVTTASPEEVQKWYPEHFAPNDCWTFPEEEIDAEITLSEPFPVPEGYHYVACWWD